MAKNFKQPPNTSVDPLWKYNEASIPVLFRKLGLHSAQHYTNVDLSYKYLKIFKNLSDMSMED